MNFQYFQYVWLHFNRSDLLVDLNFENPEEFVGLKNVLQIAANRSLHLLAVRHAERLGLQLDVLLCDRAQGLLGGRLQGRVPDRRLRGLQGSASVLLETKVL